MLSIYFKKGFSILVGNSTHAEYAPALRLSTLTELFSTPAELRAPFSPSKDYLHPHLSYCPLDSRYPQLFWVWRLGSDAGIGTGRASGFAFSLSTHATGCGRRASWCSRRRHGSMFCSSTQLYCRTAMISKSLTQAEGERGPLHQHYLQPPLDSASSTIQSSSNIEHHQHRPSNHSNPLGVAHHQFNHHRTPVKPSLRSSSHATADFFLLPSELCAFSNPSYSLRATRNLHLSLAF